MSLSSLQVARAWVRPISQTFSEALRPPDTPAPDVDTARLQHAGYVEALSDAGLDVIVLPKADHLPDACFVEDTTVWLRESLLLTHPGAPSRAPEVDALQDFVPKDATVHRMHAPATLDGGDVLRIRDTLIVGRSSRTNTAGIAILEAQAKADGLKVRVVEIPDQLHLKSSCSLAAEDLVVAHASLDAAVFDSLDVRVEAVDEAHGANVLALGSITLVSAAAPKTAERLAQLGIPIRVVDVSEMHRADGALTCLSVRFPAPGHWAT